MNIDSIILQQKDVTFRLLMISISLVLVMIGWNIFKLLFDWLSFRLGNFKFDKEEPTPPYLKIFIVILTSTKLYVSLSLVRLISLFINHILQFQLVPNFFTAGVVNMYNGLLEVAILLTVTFMTLESLRYSCFLFYKRVAPSKVFIKGSQYSIVSDDFILLNGTPVTYITVDGKKYIKLFNKPCRFGKFRTSEMAYSIDELIVSKNIMGEDILISMKISRCQAIIYDFLEV